MLAVLLMVRINYHHRVMMAKRAHSRPGRLHGPHQPPPLAPLQGARLRLVGLCNGCDIKL